MKIKNPHLRALSDGFDMLSCISISDKVRVL